MKVLRSLKGRPHLKLESGASPPPSLRNIVHLPICIKNSFWSFVLPSELRHNLQAKVYEIDKASYKSIWFPPSSFCSISFQTRPVSNTNKIENVCSDLVKKYKFYTHWFIFLDILLFSILEILEVNIFQKYILCDHFYW